MFLKAASNAFAQVWNPVAFAAQQPPVSDAYSSNFVGGPSVLDALGSAVAAPGPFAPRPAPPAMPSPNSPSCRPASRFAPEASYDVYFANAGYFSPSCGAGDWARWEPMFDGTARTVYRQSKIVDALRQTVVDVMAHLRKHVTGPEMLPGLVPLFPAFGQEEITEATVFAGDASGLHEPLVSSFSKAFVVPSVTLYCPISTCIMATVHGFDDSAQFLKQLGKFGTVKRIIIKERTLHHGAVAALRRDYRELGFDDGGISDFLRTLSELPADDTCTIVDHGGHFARLFAHAALDPHAWELVRTRVRAVIETSSSGVMAYEKFLKKCSAGRFDFPVITVRDSHAKLVENKAVAQDILQRCYDIFARDNVPLPKKVGVIGCRGRVGRELVANLCRRGLQVQGYDIKPGGARAGPLAQGIAQEGWRLDITASREGAIRDCDLVINATGSPGGLCREDTRLMKSGCIVTGITSHDTSFGDFYAAELEAANGALLYGHATTEVLHAAVTQTVTVLGAGGLPLHILTLGNAPNLAWGSSLNQAAIADLHAEVIRILEPLPMGWAFFPLDQVVDSCKAHLTMGLVKQTCGLSAPPDPWAFATPSLFNSTNCGPVKAVPCRARTFNLATEEFLKFVTRPFYDDEPVPYQPDFDPARRYFNFNLWDLNLPVFLSEPAEWPFGPETDCALKSAARRRAPGPASPAPELSHAFCR